MPLQNVAGLQYVGIKNKLFLHLQKDWSLFPQWPDHIPKWEGRLAGTKELSGHVWAAPGPHACEADLPSTHQPALCSPVETHSRQREGLFLNLETFIHPVRFLWVLHPRSLQKDFTFLSRMWVVCLLSLLPSQRGPLAQTRHRWCGRP